MFFKKILELVKKITNPPFFYYSIFHYLRRDVSFSMAKKIWNKNKKDFLKERDFVLPSYDGSNQFVHPDMVFFRNRYWFVATPYPYGMEEYENPCIYCGNEYSSLTTIESNPLDRQEKHELGFHLSDPCLFEYKGNLFCAYRENTKYSSIENNILYFKKMNENGNWSKRSVIIDSIEDKLLSPAIYVEKNNGKETLHMIHAKSSSRDGILVHSLLNDCFQILSSDVIDCKGLPCDYYIWHIAIAYAKGMKIGTAKDKKYGLFLLRAKDGKGINKLYLFCAENTGFWSMLKEIQVPDYLSNNILTPYKSCFIPNTNDIIYSYIDKKHRYRMTIINEVL